MRTCAGPPLPSLQGRYTFKLLAVDVPSAVGGEQRIFLCGDESVYGRTSVLGELRDPFTRVGGTPLHPHPLRCAHLHVWGRC